MHARFGPGRSFPDFVLPDHDGTPRRLSELQGSDPLLLVLIRGCACPKDRAQLKELTRYHAQSLVGRCGLVAITSDDCGTARELREQLGAHFPFLHDEGHCVRDELDIAEYSDSARRSMVPHTVLLAAPLQIRRVWNGHYYWGRPSTCELHDALCDLTRDVEWHRAGHPACRAGAPDRAFITMAPR